MFVKTHASVYMKKKNVVLLEKKKYSNVWIDGEFGEIIMTKKYSFCQNHSGTL